MTDGLDIPNDLVLSQDERRAAWESRPVEGSPISKGGRQDNSESISQPAVGCQQVACLPQSPPTFDYNVLAPATQSDLRDCADRLRKLLIKSIADMVAVGNDLLAIKAQLDHGQFIPWVEKEIGISGRSAQDYMRLAIGHGKSATIALFPPSTARMLTAKFAPPEIVEQVIARADAGNIVSHTELKELFSEDHRQKKTAERDAVKNAPKRKSNPRHPHEVADAERRLLEQQEEEAKTTAAAQSIIDHFPEAQVRFLAQTLTLSVLLEFKRLVEGGDR
jgi:hypothetical protein